jgi:hypothetical protein
MSSDKLEFKRSLLVLGNLAVLLWSILATVAIWRTNPSMAWVFFLLAFAVLFFILRRLGCSTCAYCKSCTAGFGRIAGWYFGDKSTRDTRNKTALFFVAVIYGLIGLVPMAFLIHSIVQEFAILETVLLVCIAGLFVFSLATWLRKTKPPQN